MCKFKEIGGKMTFSSTNYFFLPRLLFFFFSRDPFFLILLLFLSIRNSSLHQRLFQNPRFIINLPIFIVFCSGLLGGHLKKNTQWLCFFCSHLDLSLFKNRKNIGVLKNQMNFWSVLGKLNTSCLCK